MHATICDLITDLVQNSIEAGATAIELKVEETEGRLRVVTADNGRGMDAETLAKARDPFWSDGRKHPHRKVGLGLPFLFQTAEMTGGAAEIESEEGVGTTVAFELDRRHVDLPPFGSFATAATMLLGYGFDGELTIERSVDGRGYSVDRSELREALGELDDAEGLALVRDFLESNEAEISG